MKKNEIINFNPTKRQEEILKAIIDEYIKRAEPIGSEFLVNSHFSNLSSATIRNEMFQLEKLGYIEKKHKSGGRVPSTKGYELYNNKLIKNELESDIKNKIIQILNKRGLSIDEIINESVEIINELTTLPAVVMESESNELLKKIDLIQTNENSGIILIVTSLNRVIHHPFNIDPEKDINDLQTCVRVLDERLIDTRISEISTKLSLVKNIVSSKVKEYEYYMHNIVEQIFNYYDTKTTQKRPQSFGFKHAINHPEFVEEPNKLKELLELLEDTSIWQQIALNQKELGKTLITYYGNDNGHESLAIASTSIKLPTSNKQISVVGPTRMDYSKIKSLLNFLKDEVEKIIGTKK